MDNNYELDIEIARGDTSAVVKVTVTHPTEVPGGAYYYEAHTLSMTGVLSKDSESDVIIALALEDYLPALVAWLSKAARLAGVPADQPAPDGGETPERGNDER